jgi:hypothetical protein
MDTHICHHCKSIWTDIRHHPPCPNCGIKFNNTLVSQERSIQFRLIHSHGQWSVECRGKHGNTQQFEKVSWSEKPPKEVIHKTLSLYLNQWLEE